MFGVSTLVTLVAIVVGALSIYTMHAYVAVMTNSELAHSLAAFEHLYASNKGSPVDDQLTSFTGQPTGTIIMVITKGRVVQSAEFGDAGSRAAPNDAISAIQARQWSAGARETLRLGDLGRYRVGSVAVDPDTQLVSAMSLRGAEDAIAKKTAAVVVVIAAAAILAAAGTVLLVQRALRPLRRVAATAAHAAQIPMSEEDFRITTRVRQADSDPDSEVGIVGQTLNRLLANVDSALAARSEADRRMKRFLTDASHELRTPLAAIYGYAELTRQEGEALPETTEYALARIESEAKRMSALVDDMLLLSRLDEGQALEIEPVDLCTVAVDAINDVGVTASEHRFVADLPDEAVLVNGDPSRLQQVLGNLLANARNHTPVGVTVTTTLVVVDGMAKLTVRDDGPGIDPDLLPDLFGRFVRADKARSRSTSSTGLGLAIVSSIVQAHGGNVSVASIPGCTEFTVTMPTVAGGNSAAAVIGVAAQPQ